MTVEELREAMHAALMRIDDYPDETWRLGLAMDAYQMADAMLAIRDGGNGGRL